MKFTTSNTHTDMAALRRSHVIEIFRIDTMIKGLDNQGLCLQLIRNGNQVLCIASHQEKKSLTSSNLGTSFGTFLA